MRNSERFYVATAAVGTLLAAAVMAQAPREGGAAASSQALQQLQQLASERTQLQAENAKLKQQVARLTEEREKAADNQGEIDRKLRIAESAGAAARRQRDDLQSQLDTERSRTQELVQRSRELIETLRATETTKAASQRDLAQRDLELRACVDRNATLFRIGSELTDKLERTGLWSRTSPLEPFTKLKRIELDNLAQDYKQRLEDQRTDTAAPAGVPAVPPPG